MTLNIFTLTKNIISFFIVIFIFIVNLMLIYFFDINDFYAITLSLFIGSLTLQILNMVEKTMNDLFFISHDDKKQERYEESLRKLRDEDDEREEIVFTSLEQMVDFRDKLNSYIETEKNRIKEEEEEDNEVIN